MTGCTARYDAALGMWVVDEPDEVREVLLDPGRFRPDNAVVAVAALSVKAPGVPEVGICRGWSGLQAC